MHNIFMVRTPSNIGFGVEATPEVLQYLLVILPTSHLIFAFGVAGSTATLNSADAKLRRNRVHESLRNREMQVIPGGDTPSRSDSRHGRCAQLAPGSYEAGMESLLKRCT